MPTNDERREVAENLRTMTMRGCRYKEEFYDLLNETVMNEWDFHSFSDVAERLADLIEPEPERTCLVLCVKHGPVFDVLRFSCCGYEWAENRTDKGATEPDPNYCPNCGAKAVGE